MLQPYLTSIQPVEILEALKAYPFLADYHLSLYNEQDGLIPRQSSQFKICGIIEQNSHCSRFCQSTLDDAAQRAIDTGEPVVFRCHTGLLNFTIPLNLDKSPYTCLVGGGVREKDINLLHMEDLAKSNRMDAFSLLDELEKLPVSTEDGVREVAQRLHDLVPSLTDKVNSYLFEKVMQRLQALAGIFTEIDRLDSAERIIDLVSETIGILFDIPRIAVLLPEGDGTHYRVAGTWGIEGTLTLIPITKVSSLLQQKTAASGFSFDDDCDSLFPGIKGSATTCVPLVSGDHTVGVLGIFDKSLPPRELLLLQLITCKASTKLASLQQVDNFKKESCTTKKLLTIISTLSLIESKEELSQRILEMAADLVDASCGSLMFIDDNEEALVITSALGMNQQLAQSMSVRVGAGIAGRVAASGNPLLVNDIEKDTRIGIPNRPRFKTKSFVSVPVKIKDNIIGVLNLSDKKNQGIFTEADLQMILSFTTHAAVMLERSTSVEQLTVLEQLSITDPLTGLYNRRFLKKRMEEELSRSMRQELNFTVILVDLDNFKIYNDLCGHLAGDNALRKTARILTASARQMDIVTRYGGEEFCIILPGTSKKESMFVAERIKREIENEEFPHEEKLPLGRLTASIGISSFPEDGNTKSALIKASDIALYRAKFEGRNRIVMASPDDDQEKTKPVLKKAVNKK